MNADNPLSYGQKSFIVLVLADAKTFAPARTPIVEVTPVALAKAIKNDAELAGFVNCHVRRGQRLIISFETI